MQSSKIFFFALCFLLLAVAGCRKRSDLPSTSDAKLDVCALIKNDEIQAVQGSPITDTKSSEQSDGTLRVTQCYFSTAELNRSVSLAVRHKASASSDKSGPRDFWKGMFGQYTSEQKDDKEKRESLGEQSGEREKHTPPTKVEGVGEEAYWVGDRVGGALYALKKDFVLRLSLGGPDTNEAKIEKSKTLAQKALDRL